MGFLPPSLQRRRRCRLVGGPVVSEMVISVSADRVVAHGFGVCRHRTRDGSFHERLHPGPAQLGLVTFHQRDRQTAFRVAKRGDVVSFPVIFTVADVVTNAVVNEASHGLISVVFDGVVVVGGDSNFLPRPREEGTVDVGSDRGGAADVVARVRQLLQIVRLSVTKI